MNARLKITTPPMRELNVSNPLLDDQAALQAAWDRDGYWFFRDVLDKDAIARRKKSPGSIKPDTTSSSPARAIVS